MPATIQRPTARRPNTHLDRTPCPMPTACALAVAAALAQMAQPAVAASCTWTPATGNWAVAGNWSCGLVPGGADTTTVTTGTVTVNTAQATLGLSNAGTVNIDASQLTLVGGGSSTNTGTINVGGPSSAVLQVNHALTNTGGTINVANGSAVNLGGVAITGGTIATTGTGAVVGSANSSNLLNGLTLNGRLDATGGGAQVRVRNLTLNGSADVGATGVVYLDGTAGASTLGGTGTVNLNAAGARLNVEGASNQVIGAGVTVRGTGTVGQATILSGNGATTLTNNGRFSADVNGGTLNIAPIANGGTVVNNGVMEARNGGTLQLSTAVSQGGTARVTAETGSAVLINNATVSGGVLSTVGTGALRATNVSANALSGATVNGTVDLASATSQLRVTGGLALNGAINVGAGSNLYLDSRTVANQSITTTGTATIALSGGAIRMEGTGQSTTGPNVAIRGFGDIGQAIIQSAQHTWINNGSVTADVSGQTLNLQQPGNGTQPIQNNGTFAAINGGRLLLSADVVGGGASQVSAGAGSVVEMNGVTVSGALNTTGSGSFRASNTSSNQLSGVTLNGNVDLASQASQLRVSNGLVLNGTIDVGSSSALYLDNRTTATQSVTTTGTGTIALAGGALRMEGTGQTTTGPNVAIRGFGTVGAATLLSGQHTWVNNGTVTADVLNQTLTLQAPGNGVQPIQNNGTLAATNGGRLLLSADVAGSPASQINAGAGSIVEMNGVTVSGTLNTTGSGSFRTSNTSNNLLSGVTLNGRVDLASQTSQLRIGNGLVLNGTLDVGSSSTLYIDNRTPTTPTATQGITTTGAGAIALAGGAVRFEGAGQTTVGSGVSIRGSGIVGGAIIQSGAQQLVNNGTIVADVAGQTLTVQPIANGSVAIQNNGTIGAANGGTMRMTTGVVGGAGSRIDVAAGSRFVVDGTTLSGVVNQTGTGAIEATNSFSNALSAATLSGRVNLATASPSQLRITDGLTMNAGSSITVGSGSALYVDNRATPTQTIAGNGQIVMQGGALRFEGGTSTTVGAGVTIRGNGSMGQAISLSANQTLVNNGTIVAEGGTLSITPIANAGAIQGSGTLRADGGTLSLGTGQPTSQGTLDLRATGSVALGNQNITLSNDYTNAQSGSGNAFDRRAGVTGTGQILAGGNAAQAITGANVTNGTTTNATLTIGNVRVGTTTYDYQVANTGTTGPTLRGAIQTSVNGGNITDARLSGAGVTAANYTAGAPGGNSGNLGVNFTATTAGLLAPLTGQAVNLRSNFDNIPDQKLNIVAGAGAAAYNAAQGSASPSPTVTVANQRIGGTGTAALTISNTAAAGAFTETLNASFTGSSGAATTNGGSITGGAGTGVAGGASNNTAMAVGVNTATAGAKTGTVTVGYVSNGAGTSGLASIGVGGQTLNVQGNVYQVANPTTLPTSVNFGNYRVGATLSQNVSIANTAIAPAGFQEGLNANATATGAATVSGGPVVNLAAGAPAANLAVGMTSAAGAQSGQVNVALASNGTGTSGLATLGLGSQSIAVQGTGYVAASGALQTSTLNFGTLQVGQQISTNLVVNNTATGPTGFVEDLNARFGASGNGQITGSGALAGIRAGQASTAANGTMTVTVNGSTAGALNSAIAVNYFSAGAVAGASNGLGELAVGSQNFNVNGTIVALGNVVDQAAPRVNGVSNPSPVTVNLGNVRQGATAGQALTLENVATGNQQAALSSSIAATGGGATAAGSVSLLAPGSSSTALQVGLDTSVAGARTGTASIAHLSDASNVGNCAPNCALSLGSQSVTVNANVYRTANGAGNAVTAALAPTVLAARVGDAAPTAVVNVTNTSPDAFTERLNVTAATGASGPFNASLNAAATGIAAQATAGAVGVTMSTATAGAFTGSVTLQYASTGAGTTGAADLAVGSGTVGLTGRVYTPATVQLAQSTINFGIVHVGDTLSDISLGISNGAADTALNDLLVGSVNVVGSGFSGGGSLGAGLDAGQGSGSLVRVGLDTSGSGVFSGQAQLALASRNPDLADLSLSAGPILLFGQVNNFASAGFGGGGVVQTGANSYLLDLGTVLVGSSGLSTSLFALNDAGGLADLLSGLFGLGAGSTAGFDFGYTGFGAFSGLGAGDQTGPLGISFTNTGTAGVYDDLITLSGIGSNASGFSGAVADVTLLVRVSVAPPSGDVPLPGSVLLLGLGLLAMVGASRTRARGRLH